LEAKPETSVILDLLCYCKCAVGRIGFLCVFGCGLARKKLKMGIFVCRKKYFFIWGLFELLFCFLQLFLFALGANRLWEVC